MKKMSVGPFQRVGVCLLSALLCSALTACQSPRQQLDELASQHGQRLEVLAGQSFSLLMATSSNPISVLRLRVYLEGDGHAWATRSQPSLDPSPHDLLVARLAFSDPTPSLYLARPCQFVRSQGCETVLWTQRRFSEPVVSSLSRALDNIKQRYGNQQFELIGYSGGAALALLLAAQRNDVTQVQTLAGNLSPRYWAQVQRLSPLEGSLEPLDYSERLARIPQRHLVGADDGVVPAAVPRHYLDELGRAPCAERVELPGVSHHDGWEAAWTHWQQQPLRCAADALR